MKIAITSTGNSLESAFEPRFGRCAYFLLVDTETLAFEAMSNPAMEDSGGAGVRAATAVAEAGVQAVVSGQVGPKATQALTAAGVKIYTSTAATVREALSALPG